jgi:hypothetical protein
VEDHDVLSPDRSPKVIGVLPHHPLVRRTLALAERSSVAGVAVQQVVEPLRHGEEVGVSLDHRPSHVDARSAGVRDEEAKHLGDAAPRRRRVHVPEDATPEQPLDSLDAPLEGLPLVVVEQLAEPRQGQGRDAHLVRMERHRGAARLDRIAHVRSQPSAISPISSYYPHVRWRSIRNFVAAREFERAEVMRGRR